MKNYNYQRIDEMVQPLIEMMRAEYPNDAQLVIDSNSAKIQYVHTDMIFLETSLKPKNGGCKELTETIPGLYDGVKDLIASLTGSAVPNGGGGDG